MKNTKIKIVTVLICAVLSVISFASCDGREPVGESTLLGEPKAVERVEYSELVTAEYKSFTESMEAFAAEFAAFAYSDYAQEENFAVAPISVYMALALSAECTAGDTRQEILNGMGVTYSQLKTYFSTLYRSLAVEYKAENQVTGMLNLANSIWVNEGTSVKQDCIQSLSDNFYAYFYSADFANKNSEANRAVRDYVKEQTYGLIDQDFQLSPETMFVLINALYLKAVWNTNGTDLSFTQDNYDFTARDGSVQRVKLLMGDYVTGRAVRSKTYSTFYTSTYNGYKIKFIVPNDGYTVDQVFTAENIFAVNSITDYGGYDEVSDTRYLTRVLFPEYHCAYDNSISQILHDRFGIDLLFKAPDGNSPASGFSALTDELCYCANVRHVTDLTVDRKGIEGAAVTIMEVDGAARPTLTVQEDFIVNKSFGFMITDANNVTLFSGVVDHI